MTPRRPAADPSASARNLHASAVAFGPQRGILILGASGSGKSSLALALIDLGAQLVSDDQVLLTAIDGDLYARPPRAIAGLIEARGLGLLHLLHQRLARIAMVVDLDRPRGPRLPEPDQITLHAVTLMCLAGTASAAYASALARQITNAGRAESRACRT